MNILSPHEFELGKKLASIQIKKEFRIAMYVVFGLSVIVHLFGNRYLKMADISIVIFFGMIWGVGWEGRSNREIAYFFIAWLAGCSLLTFLAV